MLEVSDLHASYGADQGPAGREPEGGRGRDRRRAGRQRRREVHPAEGDLRQHPPDSGTITFLGRPRPAQAHKVVAGGISHVPEGRQIYADLTVFQNLQIGAFLRKDKDGVKQDLDRVFGYFPILQDRIGQYGGLLSGGEQQMLAISRGLMARPKILMLDEPSLGLAPLIVNQIFQILKEINRTGTAILIVEQNARKALAIAHRAYLMTTGEIERSGASDELMEAESLYKIYLGKAEA